MISDQRYLNRIEAAAFLTKRGYKTAPATLAKRAVTGGGPPFRSWGRKPLYDPEALLSWAQERCTGPRHRRRICTPVALRTEKARSEEYGAALIGQTESSSQTRQPNRLADPLAGPRPTKGRPHQIRGQGCARKNWKICDRVPAVEWITLRLLSAPRPRGIRTMPNNALCVHASIPQYDLRLSDPHWLGG